MYPKWHILEYLVHLINTNNEIYTVLRDSDTILIDKLAIQINLLNVTQVENALVNFSLLISGSAEAIRDLSGQFGELLKKSQLKMGNCRLSNKKRRAGCVQTENNRKMCKHIKDKE